MHMHSSQLRMGRCTRLRSEELLLEKLHAVRKDVPVGTTLHDNVGRVDSPHQPSSEDSVDVMGEFRTPQKEKLTVGNGMGKNSRISDSHEQAVHLLHPLRMHGFEVRTFR